MQDRGKWYVMLSVGAGLFLAKMDTSIVNIALPTLERVFDAKFALVQWVVLIYLLVTTALLLSIGRLADMVGRKTIYLLGYILFVMASAFCGLAPSIGVLLLARGFQAVGAAMILALGLPIVTEAFPSSQRGLAIGVAGVAVSVGIEAGPPVGGVLIELLDWRWIFLVNVPIGIVGALLASRFVPATKSAGRQRLMSPARVCFCWRR